MGSNRRPTREEVLEEHLEALLAYDRRYLEVAALLDRDAAFRRILELLPETLGFDVAFVAEHRDTDEVVINQLRGTRTAVLRGLVIPRGLGLGGKAFALGQVQWVDDYSASRSISHHFDEPVRVEGIRAVIAAPIQHDDRVFGVLYAAARGRTTFGGRVIGAVQAAADQLAVAATAAERARGIVDVAIHEERRRLAQELHDSVGAMLFTIRAGITELGEGLEAAPELRARLLDIEDQAAEASARLRESLWALSASPQEMVLPVTLRADCSEFEQSTGIPARLVLLSELPSLDQPRVRALADTVREALLNVKKHARARSVAVIASATLDGVTIAVTDDGIGLAHAAADGRGLGLEACAERLGRLGGYLSVDDNDEGGVTLRVWIPA
jgi:signal transduction histidine kinase